MVQNKVFLVLKKLLLRLVTNSNTFTDSLLDAEVFLKNKGALVFQTAHGGMIPNWVIAYHLFIFWINKPATLFG